MSVVTLCNRTATLFRHQVRQDPDTGGQLPNRFVPDPVAVNVPCSIQPNSVETAIAFMQVQMRASSLMYFPDDWNTFTGDVWRTDDGRQFKVLSHYNSLELDDCWVDGVDEWRVPLDVV